MVIKARLAFLFACPERIRRERLAPSDPEKALDQFEYVPYGLAPVRAEIFCPIIGDLAD
jgi:hypothetical protein